MLERDCVLFCEAHLRSHLFVLKDLQLTLPFGFFLFELRLFDKKLCCSEASIFVFLVFLSLFFGVADGHLLKVSLQLALDVCLLIEFPLSFLLLLLFALLHLLHEVLGKLLLLLLLGLPFSFVDVHESVHWPADASPRISVSSFSTTIVLVLVARAVVPILQRLVFMRLHRVPFFLNLRHLIVIQLSRVRTRLLLKSLLAGSQNELLAELAWLAIGIRWHIIGWKHLVWEHYWVLYKHTWHRGAVV